MQQVQPIQFLARALQARSTDPPLAPIAGGPPRVPFSSNVSKSLADSRSFVAQARWNTSSTSSSRRRFRDWFTRASRALGNPDLVESGAFFDHEAERSHRVAILTGRGDVRSLAPDALRARYKSIP